MADLAVTLVMVTSVTIQQALHGLDQWSAGDFEQHIKLVKHQDIAVKSDRVALAYLIQQGLESTVVLIVLIDLLPLVTSADDMVKRTGKVDSGLRAMAML